MAAILIDSNILLGLMVEDLRWFGWAAAEVRRAADRSRLVINAIIYSEVSVRYSRIEDLEAALPKDMFDREAIPDEAAFLAGRHFSTIAAAAGRSIRRCPTSSSALMPRLRGTD